MQGVWTVSKGWIGVDLDGTLAHHKSGDFNANRVGAPIPLMVGRVKQWLAEGREVRIMTARVALPTSDAVVEAIQHWCSVHIGQVLPVTCQKDYAMIELWDDRAVQVIPNSGEALRDKLCVCRTIPTQ